MRSLSSVVSDFAECVMQQKQALQQTDARSGNRWAKRRVRAWRELQRAGDAGREALAALLADPRDDVRAMAAAYLLRYKHAEAKRVLEEVAKHGQGIAAFGASQCLERWKEGDWHLDDV
jgi:hypothetical protein